MSENRNVVFDTDLCAKNPEAAADRIAELEAVIERLRKALRPFAEAANHYSNGKHRPPVSDDFPCQGFLHVKDLRAARAILEAAR